MKKKISLIILISLLSFSICIRDVYASCDTSSDYIGCTVSQSGSVAGACGSTWKDFCPAKGERIEASGILAKFVYIDGGNIKKVYSIGVFANDSSIASAIKSSLETYYDITPAIGYAGIIKDSNGNATTIVAKNSDNRNVYRTDNLKKAFSINASSNGNANQWPNGTSSGLAPGFKILVEKANIKFDDDIQSIQDWFSHECATALGYSKLDDCHKDKGGERGFRIILEDVMYGASRYDPNSSMVSSGWTNKSFTKEAEATIKYDTVKNMTSRTFESAARGFSNPCRRGTSPFHLYMDEYDVGIEPVAAEVPTADQIQACKDTYNNQKSWSYADNFPSSSDISSYKKGYGMNIIIPATKEQDEDKCTQNSDCETGCCDMSSHTCYTDKDEAAKFCTTLTPPGECKTDDDCPGRCCSSSHTCVVCKYKINVNTEDRCETTDNKGHISDIKDWNDIFTSTSYHDEAVKNHYWNPAYENKYCKVYCRETIAYEYPGKVSIRQGMGMTVGENNENSISPITLTGTKQCRVTSTKFEGQVNIVDFVKDIDAANINVSAKWDLYQKAEAVYQAALKLRDVSLGNYSSKSSNSSYPYNEVNTYTCYNQKDGGHNLSEASCNNFATICNNGVEQNCTNQYNACVQRNDQVKSNCETGCENSEKSCKNEADNKYKDEKAACSHSPSGCSGVDEGHSLSYGDCETKKTNCVNKCKPGTENCSGNKNTCLDGKSACSCNTHTAYRGSGSCEIRGYQYTCYLTYANGSYSCGSAGSKYQGTSSYSRYYNTDDEGSTCYSASHYDMSSHSENSLNTVISDALTARDEALATYRKAVKDRDTLQGYYEACTNYPNLRADNLKYNTFKPSLTINYDEPYYGNYNGAGYELVASSKDKSENFSTSFYSKGTAYSTKSYSGSGVYSTQVGTTTCEPGKACIVGDTSGSQTAKVKCESGACKDTSYSLWWNSEDQVSYSYRLAKTVYRYVVKSTGVSVNSRPTNEQYVDTGVGNLPVHYSTPINSEHDYKITLSSFGDGNKFNQYILDDNYFDSKKYNINNSGNNWVYNCNYVVGPIPIIVNQNKIEYRSISLISKTAAFPGRDGTGRTPGSNWQGDEIDYVDTYILNGRGVTGYDIYKLDPMYEITLDVKTIKQLRKYNEEMNRQTAKITYEKGQEAFGIKSYSSFDHITCENATGLNCKSDLLRGIVDKYDAIKVTGCAISQSGYYSNCGNTVAW